ncbi:hypothetical protein, partial [Taylorella equigenitalis]|uniref:IS1634 family transposase n=1 Tax=Taylorella equigenitalis TaxID=29575 RepID=UPI00051D7B6E
MFKSAEDEALINTISSLSNSNIQTIGPELIFGKIYDYIGFNRIKEKMFRHMVISRLSFPLSKLKITDYLHRYQNIDIDVNAIYRFLDKLESKYKYEVEQIAFNHTQRMVGGKISVVFYDMTTLHFESEDEDDLRRTGFSKVGKHTHPQIYLGLMVSCNGFAIGYD